MRIKIKLDSAAASARLRKWGGQLREKVRKAGTRSRAQWLRFSAVGESR